MLISQDWVTRILGAKNPGWNVSAADMDSGFVRVGFETEGYAAVPESTGPLVIGQVVEIEELTQFKKPIRYCQVNVGQANGTGELQGIICGARNFRLSDYVVVALPGSELPGGFKIAARETYDHISNGMLCSGAELGLGAQANGIIVLGDDVADKVGEDARPIIGLHDTDFDVNITPDRGYALSARGLSREIASAFDLEFADIAEDPSVAGIDTSAVPAAQGSLIDVTLDPATKAQRFGLRKVSGIDPQARTPFWLERELMLCGQRSVNLPTDITNYVMLLLGTPMHAFDANVIQGNLVVRNAEEGEKFETLDHVKRELSAEDVVICDDNGIQSLAGVMGGTTSEISAETTDVVFESAIWDPITVARTSRRHKLSSESSRRFERGVDPAVVEVALDTACALLQQLAGGTIEEGRTLIGDVAKRHGTLRSGPAQSYLRSEDPALLQIALKAAPLRLLAPTVAVSQLPVHDLLERLRDHGLSPAAEDESGASLNVAPEPATLSTPTARRATTSPDIAKAMRTLRDDAAPSTPSLDIVHAAARTARPITIGYADKNGNEKKRTVTPLTVAGGQIDARAADGSTIRFPLHRITSVTLEP